jgi:hypothetical protein
VSPKETALNSLVELATRSNNGKSTVVVRVWSDGTCDLEQYSRGEEVGEYGVRNNFVRMVESVLIEQIDKGIDVLSKEKFRVVRVQAPQDARAQIHDLKQRIKELLSSKENRVD